MDEGLKLNKLSLNVKKSKFYMPGRNVIILNLHINSIKLECLDYFNFLCITLDKHLKGLAQAKIKKKSVILFWLLNMTI